MGNSFDREPMLDLYLFETTQLIEQLEQLILNSEQGNNFDNSINEIFRIMHTIKGSAAMMLFTNVSNLAHAIEDLFYLLRESKPAEIDYSKLSDLVLSGVDFIKNETQKVQDGSESNGDSASLIQNIKNYLQELRGSSPNQPNPAAEKAKTETESPKFYIGQDRSAERLSEQPQYEASLYFAEDCQMEDVRAFTLLHQLKEKVEIVSCVPEVVIDDNACIEAIRQDGLKIAFTMKGTLDEIEAIFNKTPLIKDLDIHEKPKASLLHALPIIQEVEEAQQIVKRRNEPEKSSTGSVSQRFINVNVEKLDKLMDLVAELVISEAMVTHHPELDGLALDSFHKASGQLRKITNELQDIVMAIRMVPLTNTFMKMQRIVRDMSHKLQKEVELELIGEETEVDKNIIEQLSDPLMHLIRNAIDHGIESQPERQEKGKPAAAKITLEAKNSGNEVWIVIRDDGRGLDKDKILKKALENGLVTKPESELTEREIFAFILQPGFSTKEKITEFSGRGVGMDVVVKNIEKVGGTVLIDSVMGVGTSISLKIPLTLAIIDGMSIQVGNSLFTLPTTTIQESFRVKEEDVITDPDGDEMILIRGKCHPFLRLHELYKIETDTVKLHEGIIVMVESDDKSLCLFADRLLGEQQVVVKGLPRYIKKVRGLAGCTLLGDGSISLILDVPGLLHF